MKVYHFLRSDYPVLLEIIKVIITILITNCLVFFGMQYWHQNKIVTLDNDWQIKYNRSIANNKQLQDDLNEARQTIEDLEKTPVQTSKPVSTPPKVNFFDALDKRRR